MECFSSGNRIFPSKGMWRLKEKIHLTHMQQNEAEPEDLPRKKIPWLWLTGILLAAGVFGLGGWYFLAKVRSSLSARMYAKATSFIEEDRKTDAMLALKSALRLDSSNLEAWHQLATFEFDRGNNAAALDTFLKLFQAANAHKTTDRLPQIFSSIRDQRMLMLVAQRQGEGWLLSAAADGLGLMAGNKALSSLMRADCLSASGETQAALRKLSTDSLSNQIFTAPWKLSDLLNGKKSSPLDREAYFEILTDLENRLGPLAHNVVFFALKSSLVPTARIFEYANRLVNDPGAPMNIRIYGARVVAAMSGTPVALDFAYPANPNKLSADERILLAREFLSAGYPAKALSLVEGVTALDSKNAFRIWITALSALDRRDEVLEALSLTASPLSQNETFFETVKIKYKKTPTDEFLATFKLPAIHPKNATETMTFADFLAEMGLVERLASLMRSIPPGSHEAVSLPKTVLSRANQRGDLQIAINFQTARLLSDKSGTSLDILAERETMVLLAGGIPDMSALQGLMRYNPDSVPVRIAYAFAVLNSGEKSAALDLLKKHSEKINVHSLTTHQKVAVVSILAANDLTDSAHEVACLALTENLYPVEVERLAPVFRRVRDEADAKSGTGEQP